MRSSNCPERPTKGSPRMSSSCPGPSPTISRSASRLPTPGTFWVQFCARSQSVQASIASSIASQESSVFAAGLAICAASCGEVETAESSGTDPKRSPFPAGTSSERILSGPKYRDLSSVSISGASTGPVSSLLPEAVLRSLQTWIPIPFRQCCCRVVNIDAYTSPN